MQDVADDRLQAHLRWELLAGPCGSHTVGGRSGRGGADQWLDRPASLGALRLRRRVGAGRQVAFAVAVLDTAVGGAPGCGGLGAGLRLVGGGQPLGLQWRVLRWLAVAAAELLPDQRVTSRIAWTGSRCWRSAA